MDLDAYETATRRHCIELMKALRKFGVARLHAACSKAGSAAAAAYLLETNIAARDYLSSTPARRKTLLNKIPPPERGLFLLCATYHARCALALLEALCSRGVTAGPSYWMVTAQAAAAMTDLEMSWPMLWPFLDEENLEDPFGGL